MLTGALAPGPAMLALALVAAGALVLARIWLGNLARLAEAIRGAEEGTGELPELQGPALLPSVEEIAQAVQRLARRMRERGELVGQLRRADAAIVEKLPDPLLVLGTNRAPLRANHAARVLFGAAAAGGGTDPPLGGDLAALLRHPNMAEAVDRALAEGLPQTVDVALPVPVARDLATQIIPMEPALSDGGQLVVVLADRTRERAVERMRADFVANASHELRTPLSSLIGFIETLRGPAEDDREARARFLGIMAEQADRMRRLIDDLLGLSRIELTEHQPPTGRVKLAELARAELDAMAPVLEARRARVESQIDPAAVAEPADAGQLAQVLRNLLENALRHGKPGGVIRLAVAIAQPEAAEPAVNGMAVRRWPARPGVVLSVQDDGPGIPKEHIPRLTERFYRVDKGRSRDAGGTGLGLAIVKHIVNRHRGRLLIESEEGAGATFSVWLPSE
jgi:two-component system, OmpR family, phosphate regulon sensor histidine kinase PhoR